MDLPDLLEHLIDVCQHGSVEVAEFVHGEEIFERAFGGLQDGVFDGEELVLHVLAIGFPSAKHCKHVHGFFLFALENEPAGRLGKLEDKENDGDAEEDLKCKL